MLYDLVWKVLDRAQACKENKLDALVSRAQFDQLRRAKQFAFPGTREEVEELLRTSVPSPWHDKAAEEFFLPFPTVYLEDSVSGMVIERRSTLQENARELWRGVVGEMPDPQEEDGENPLGICHFFSVTEYFKVQAKRHRDMIELVSDNNDAGVPAAYMRFDKDILMGMLHSRRLEKPGFLMRSAWFQGGICPEGLITSFAHMASQVRDGDGVSCWSKTFLIDDKTNAPKPEDEQMFLDFSTNIGFILRQIVAINSPANMVIQKNEQVSHVVRRRSGKTKTKFSERTRYLVLPRRTAYSFITGDKGEGSHERSAHARRRHWRTLRAKRFGSNVGKRVCVSECWVGQRERLEGTTRYKVLLDLGAPLPRDSGSMVDHSQI